MGQLYGIGQTIDAKPPRPLLPNVVCSHYFVSDLFTHFYTLVMCLSRGVCVRAYKNHVDCKRLLQRFFFFFFLSVSAPETTLLNNKSIDDDAILKKKKKKYSALIKMI